MSDRDDLIALATGGMIRAWTDEEGHDNAPPVIADAVLEWLAAHDRAVAEKAWAEGVDAAERAASGRLALLRDIVEDRMPVADDRHRLAVEIGEAALRTLCDRMSS